jgi:fatty-acyl-CoA synthase
MTSSSVYNLAQIVFHNATRSPEREALVFGETRLTNRELADRTRSLAAALRSLGISRGDVVAILLPNCLEYIEISLAINAVGGVFLPLNTRLAHDEWEFIVSHARAKLIFVDEARVEHALTLTAECEDLQGVVQLGGSATGASHSYQDLLAEFSNAQEGAAEVGIEDTSRLMYTSGTTGRPKGVSLTYGNVIWKTMDHVTELQLTAADRILVVGPLYHVGGYDLPGVGAFTVGASLVILPKFDPLAVVSTIEAEKITGIWLPPSMVNAILQEESVSRFDVASLRFMINGGEKMPEHLVRRLVDIFPNCWIADAFGMTETVSGDTFLDREHTFSKLGSVGKPVRHLEVKVQREDGSQTNPGESGDLWIRGPKVFSAYWRDEEATRNAFRDGWFNSGDVAHFDNDGYLYIDDRRKDMIISGGENIASAEIERILYLCDGVLEAAVVAKPNVQWGEVPLAFVVAKPNQSLTSAEIVEFCRGRLAPFKVPKEVVFLEALPRTSSGKVMKRVLRESVQ